MEGGMLPIEAAKSESEISSGERRDRGEEIRVSDRTAGLLFRSGSGRLRPGALERLARTHLG